MATGSAKIVLTICRRLRGWSQAEMAAQAGVSTSSLSEYEKGKAEPSRTVLERLVRAAGLPMWVVDGALVPVVELARQAMLEERAAPAAFPSHATAAESLALAQFLAAAPTPPWDGGATGTTTQKAAVDPWALLPPAAAGLNVLTDDLATQFAALIGRLCIESSAKDEAQQALILARLARQVAETAPGEASWRLGLQSKTWAFEGSALRRLHDRRAAAAAFSAARELRRLAGPAAEGLFAEKDLAALEAAPPPSSRGGTNP